MIFTPQTADAYVAVRRGPYGRSAVVVRPGVRRGVYYRGYPRYYTGAPYYGPSYYHGVRPYYYGGVARRTSRRVARRVTRRHGY